MRKLYRLAELPLKNVPFRELPLRGILDSMVPSDQGVIITGWMALPGQPIDEVEVHHQGNHLFTKPVASRPDVKKAYPWLPYAESTGFAFELPLTPDQARATTRLDLVCRQGAACRRGRMSVLVRRDVDEFPTAPAAYMYRVAHRHDEHAFKLTGLKNLGDFLEPVARHGDLSKVRRMLDWGCGCGRVGMYFLAAEDCPEYAGGDIDAEAIRWAQAHLPDGAFSVLGSMPPTPYLSDHFDLIVAFSVFTHLTREVQHAWLGEMRRILSPGGLFLATLHGPLVYAYSCGSLTKEFPRAGIVDSAKDETLKGIAPKGYYRATFQSKEYTLREFGKYFKVLEYVEQGAGMQDLVVLQKQ